MKCPVCDTEAMITSNEIVQRQDGTLAYRTEYTCRNPQCPKDGQVIETEYDLITPIIE